MANNPIDPKDPLDVLPYTWDFAPETNSGDSDLGDFLNDGEVISTHTVTPETGITVDSSSITDAGKSVTAIISGGTNNENYEVTCHATTSAGAQINRKMVIRVRDR